MCADSTLANWAFSSRAQSRGVMLSVCEAPPCGYSVVRCSSDASFVGHDRRAHVRQIVPSMDASVHGIVGLHQLEPTMWIQALSLSSFATRTGVGVVFKRHHVDDDWCVSWQLVLLTTTTTTTKTTTTTTTTTAHSSLSHHDGCYVNRLHRQCRGIIHFGFQVAKFLGFLARPKNECRFVFCFPSL